MDNLFIKYVKDVFKVMLKEFNIQMVKLGYRR